MLKIFSAPAIQSRLDAINESQTLAMARKVRELRAEGRQVYSFTLGEPDFGTPEYIREAAIQAIREGDTHYPPVAGQPALREAFAQHLQSTYQLSYQPNEVMVSTGAKQSLMNLLIALVQPGEEVIIPAPFWVSYLPMVQIAEGVPVVIQTKDVSLLKLTPEQLEAALTPKTRILLLNSPSNPTGSVYSEAEIRSLAEVLERWPNVWVISDEIYALVRYVDKFFSPAHVESLKHRTIIVNGVSKAFAMTGWRIGTMAGPKTVIDLCEKYQGQVTSGACSIAQRAATAAFSQPLDATYSMVAAFKARRDLALRLLHELMPELTCVKPEGAFYLFPNIKAYLGKSTPGGSVLTTPEALCTWLLAEAGVAVVSGEGFGSDEHLRISYACSEENIEGGIKLMGEAFSSLR